MGELVFDSITVQFGRRRSALVAVDNVNLIVPAGTTVGLVGESGSGKSTLARAAVGLAPITAGRVLLDGLEIPRRPRGSRPVQMVFQDPYSSLDPRMTIGDSIAEAFPRGRLSTPKERRGEVARLLELVNLDSRRATMLPAQLSGGQRQRVGLARALAGKPKVVIADEITSALDVSVQGTVLNLVRELQRQLGLSMLFISHNLAVVGYVSDMIAVMYQGQIVEVGLTDEVLSSPQHPYTRDLFAAAPSRQTSILSGSSPDLLPDSPIKDVPTPLGCRYQHRCSIGPAALPDKDVCFKSDPAIDAARREHRAACHFAALRTS